MAGAVALLWALPWAIRASPLSVFRFDTNETVSVGGWQGIESRGSLSWKLGPETPPRSADLSVLTGLIGPAEARALVETLPPAFDEDLDSVDSQTTYEFYLQKSGSVEAISTIPNKPEMNDKDAMSSRAAARRAALAIAQPILDTRLTPFVNRRFAAACRGQCKPCHSFVRRYRDGERLAHPMHFDMQALVTAVVSLGDFGVDFIGGLYVSTGASKDYLALRSGDAVFHQSDLLHGVDVLSGSRWSWVTWYKDPETGECDDADPLLWHRDAAESGDPVAQFLHARRSPSPQDRVRWLRRAAKSGFARAQNELGVAYRDGDGVEADPRRARGWLQRAARASDQDAMSNLAMLLIGSGVQDSKTQSRIIKLLRKAATLGSTEAMSNLGVAYFKGFGVPKNNQKAVSWWNASRAPQSLMHAAGVERAAGRDARAAALVQRAAQLGHFPACREMAERAMEGNLPDVDSAERWARRGVAGGDPVSKVTLARLLLRRGGDEVGDKAVSLLQEARRAGVAEADDLLASLGHVTPHFVDEL